MKIKLIGFVILGIAAAAFYMACSSDSTTDAGTAADTGGGGNDTGTPEDTGTTEDTGTADAGGGGQTFSATLTEFLSKQPVEGVTVEAYDDTTGQPTGIKGTTDAAGAFTLTGIPAAAAKIGIMAKKAQYLPTLQYHFAANATAEKVLIISQQNVSVIAAVLGTTLDAAKGVAAGGAFWGDRTSSEPIGCAIASTDPTGGEIHYMNDSGTPSTDRDTLGTNKADGLFVDVNTTPGKITVTMTVGTATESSVLPSLPAGTLAISNVYFDKTKYTTNPTPATCAGGGDQ